MKSTPGNGNAAYELTDEELERVMRQKLGVNEPRLANTFSAEERRIADKLLGKTESQRLQNRRKSTRPFKPRKPVVTAEYYEVPPMNVHWTSFGGGWRVDVRVDGEIYRSREGMDRDECTKLVANLSRRGVTVKPIITEWMRHNPDYGKPPQTARRKTFSERYGNLGGIAA